MIKYKNYTFCLIMLLVVSTGLAGMFGLEKFFGFLPCDLCIKQRILSGILITIAGLFLLLYKINHKILIIGDILISFCVFLMFCLAIFQVGVEHKIFELPESCKVHFDPNQSIEEMNRILLDPASLQPSCDVPQLLFGVSIATWTLFGTALLFGFIILYWIVRFKK